MHSMVLASYAATTSDIGTTVGVAVKKLKFVKNLIEKRTHDRLIIPG